MPAEPRHEIVAHDCVGLYHCIIRCVRSGRRIEAICRSSLRNICRCLTGRGASCLREGAARFLPRFRPSSTAWASMESAGWTRCDTLAAGSSERRAAESRWRPPLRRRWFQGQCAAKMAFHCRGRTKLTSDRGDLRSGRRRGQRSAPNKEKTSVSGSADGCRTAEETCGRAGRRGPRPAPNKTCGQADGGVGDPRRTRKEECVRECQRGAELLKRPVVERTAGSETRAEQGSGRRGQRPAPNKEADGGVRDPRRTRRRTAGSETRAEQGGGRRGQPSPGAPAATLSTSRRSPAPYSQNWRWRGPSC